jgi:hypothetical protein
MEVFWFKNNHEQRNDLLRFGFMRLHHRGDITYREYPYKHCTLFGFSETVSQHEHRHTSLILIRDGYRQVRCLIDSEDSFFSMCPLVAEVDCYLCAGYNSEFFEKKRLFTPYSWQTESETRYYRERADELIQRWGGHFGCVRRFIPIAPSMWSQQPVPFLKQKLRNIKFRMSSTVSQTLYWKNSLLEYEYRYSELLRLRNRPLLYDVVLLDTLWGWPRHRLNLHRKLKNISNHYQIHSRLNWTDPVPYDGSDINPVDPKEFPVETNAIGNYEEMLASSRLAVFATGFHWGWRSVMSLALMIGLPVYMDRSVLEPWFSINEFTILWNDDGDWRDLEAHLASVTESEWERIKKHNQARYDSVMRPERVAEYVLSTALNQRAPNDES